MPSAASAECFKSWGPLRRDTREYKFNRIENKVSEGSRLNISSSGCTPPKLVNNEVKPGFILAAFGDSPDLGRPVGGTAFWSRYGTRDRSIQNDHLSQGRGAKWLRHILLAVL